MPAAYDELRERLAQVSDLGRARALLAWDERTMMPAAGAAGRTEQLATLARLRHELATSDELGRLLEELAPWAEGLDHDSDQASMVRVARREWEKSRRVPAELRGEIARQTSRAQHAWEAARAESDFDAFLPHLERVVDLTRRYAELFAGWQGCEHPYDPLLDDFEPEMRIGEVRAVLEPLRDGLRPLLERVAARPDAADDRCLRGSFPLAAQQAVVGRLLAELPLPERGWRLDPTVHPFATSISPGDIRLTTRYDEANLATALWSSIHEAGHGIYEAGVPERLRRSPLGRPASLAFHESQSRLWENWVGRSRPYARRLHPRLREAFGEAFAAPDAEALYRAANVCRPSLIRVEADEVTYNLHIALRFELEVELFEGRLAPRELPDAWEARTREYLGLETPDPAHGVLQDVHWAGGSFGYFPTYSLGNVIAAQLWERIEADVPDLVRLIEAGELEPLGGWLRERLHSWGGKLYPAELVERLLGRLDVAPLLRHLEERVSDVYGDPGG